MGVTHIEKSAGSSAAACGTTTGRTGGTLRTADEDAVTCAKCLAIIAERRVWRAAAERLAARA